MYDSLFVGPVQHQAAFWMLMISIGVLIALIIATTVVHFSKNRITRILQARLAAYPDIVEAVRRNAISDEDLRNRIPAKDFRYFSVFLQETISATDDIDVSTERRVADAVGFTDYLLRRIRRQAGMHRTIAIRLLSYFRDPAHTPVFMDILENSGNKFQVFTAGVGLGLCGNRDIFEKVFHKYSSFFAGYPQVLLSLLNVFGEDAVPTVIDHMFRPVLDEAMKSILIGFLAGFDRPDVAEAIWQFCGKDHSPTILAAILAAVGRTDDPGRLENLKVHLGHPEPLVRIEALHALSRCAGETLLADLEGVLSDSNWKVRYEAGNAMVRTGETGVKRLQAIAGGDHNDAGATARNVLIDLEFHRLDMGTRPYVHS